MRIFLSLSLLIFALFMLAAQANNIKGTDLIMEKYKQSRIFDPTESKVVGLATTKRCSASRKINTVFLIKDAKKILPKGTLFMVVQAHVHNITIGQIVGKKDTRQARCIIWWQYPVDRSIKNGTILVIKKS